MEDARRKRTSTPPRNAVSHQLMWFSLRSVGVPDGLESVLMDIYEGSTFQVQTSGGLTGEIPQERGGCPLSPLLFNLALAWD